MTWETFSSEITRLRKIPLIKCTRRALKVPSSEEDLVNMDPDDEVDQNDENEENDADGDDDEQFTSNFSDLIREVHRVAQ